MDLFPFLCEEVLALSMYSWVAKAYQSTCPGRTEIPGEKLCTLTGLTGQNRLSRDIIVSKFTEKQECGATETSREQKDLLRVGAGPFPQ